MSDSQPGSVTNALVELNSPSQNEQAIRLLWDRYFHRLCGFIEDQLFARHKRVTSADEVASDAFRALLDGVKASRFHSVRNRDELWQMLTLIGSRRSTNVRIKHNRQKNGEGRVVGESALGSQGFGNLADFIERDLSPVDYVELQETIEELLNQLPTQQVRQVALLRMSGYSNAEIAEKIGRVERTVELKLNLIRSIWSRSLEAIDR
jgi:DNA-directed RNA polymerase specialized sigma24 family protein